MTWGVRDLRAALVRVLATRCAAGSCDIGAGTAARPLLLITDGLSGALPLFCRPLLRCAGAGCWIAVSLVVPLLPVSTCAGPSSPPRCCPLRVVSVAASLLETAVVLSLVLLLAVLFASVVVEAPWPSRRFRRCPRRLVLALVLLPVTLAVVGLPLLPVAVTVASAVSLTLLLVLSCSSVLSSLAAWVVPVMGGGTAGMASPPNRTCADVCTVPSGSVMMALPSVVIPMNSADTIRSANCLPRSSVFRSAPVSMSPTSPRAPNGAHIARAACLYDAPPRSIRLSHRLCNAPCRTARSQ